jgi:DNA-binding transcriptional regulator PaaX
MCDKCTNLSELKKAYKKNLKDNENLLDNLIRAASDNNEFDNRRELEYYRLEVLQRMKNERKQKV